jgi:catechol-2,3-dioxygenase
MMGASDSATAIFIIRDEEGNIIEIYREWVH